MTVVFQWYTLTLICYYHYYADLIQQQPKPKSLTNQQLLAHIF